MAGTSYKVDITVTGQDHASKPIGNVNQALNTLAGVAGGMMLAQGLTAAGSMMVSAGKYAVGAAADMQRFNISLDTLAAREMVASGAAGNIGEALQEVGPITDELATKLRDLSLTSPFTFETIQQTFRLQMAFGQTADQSIALTGAILDTAAALGLGAEETDRLAYNFAQINSVGQIMGTDLRQLRMVGLDLAEVFRNELGMSVEEVNTALENGSMTMQEVSDAFVNYAANNFAGAAERMSQTAAGIQSSFQDLFYFTSTDLLSGSLETVTGYLQEFFAVARDLQASGFFTRLGDEINDNVQRIMAVFKDLLGADGPEGVLKKIGEAVVKVSDIIADALEWWNGLGSSTRQLIGDVILLVAAVGPAIGAFNTAKTVIQAAGVAMTAFSGTAMTASAALGPIAIALAAAAIAFQLYKRAQEEADAEAVRANEVGRATSDRLLASTDAYYSYIDAMAEAGQAAYALSRVEYDRAQLAQESEFQLIHQTNSWMEYSYAMHNAGLDAETLSSEEYNLAKSMQYANMSMTQADIDTWRNSMAETTPVVEGLGDEFAWLADDVSATDYAMAMLKSNMAGELGAEMDSYNDRLEDLRDEQAAVNDEIAELEGKTYLTSTQREQLDALYLRQDEIGQAFTDAATAHTEATNTIIFNLAQQQLAMSGLDPSVVLGILNDMADDMGLVDSATQTANTAIQGLISQTNVNNADNLATAIGYIAAAALDGKITAQEFRTALALLNGMVVTATVQVNYHSNGVPGVVADSGINQEDIGPPPPTTFVDEEEIPGGNYQAHGGSYLVNRPTVFVAGEAGAELAEFTPVSEMKNRNRGGGGGNTFIFNNRDKAAAALSLAYVSGQRGRKLDAEMGA